MDLEYVRVQVIYRVSEAECIIRILVAMAQEYVNTYSTRIVGSAARRGSLVDTYQQGHSDQQKKRKQSGTAERGAAVADDRTSQGSYSLIASRSHDTLNSEHDEIALNRKNSSGGCIRGV